MNMHDNSSSCTPKNTPINIEDTSISTTPTTTTTATQHTNNRNNTNIGTDNKYKDITNDTSRNVFVMTIMNGDTTLAVIIMRQILAIFILLMISIVQLQRQQHQF